MIQDPIFLQPLRHFKRNTAAWQLHSLYYYCDISQIFTFQIVRHLQNVSFQLQGSLSKMGFRVYAQMINPANSSG